jgi:hypothetical protein
MCKRQIELRLTKPVQLTQDLGHRKPWSFRENVIKVLGYNIYLARQMEANNGILSSGTDDQILVWLSSVSQVHLMRCSPPHVHIPSQYLID